VNDVYEEVRCDYVTIVLSGERVCLFSLGLGARCWRRTKTLQVCGIEKI
jgi:hypothetical protein